MDALLALLVTALALFSLFSRVSQVLLTEEGESLRYRPPDALAVVVLVVGTLALAWRRRAPLLVLVVSAAAFFLDQWLGYAPPPLPFAPLIALYTVATTSATVVAAFASAAVAGGVVVVTVFRQNGPFPDDQVLAYLISVAAAWMLGYGVQLDRTRAALLEDRTRQLAREQAAATELAVQQEKARIARELHDVVAHNVSVIVAQAAAAQRVFDRARDESRQALVSIEAAGRDALTEMRRLLGVLDTSASADRAPQPGLDQLSNLVASIERAGLPVEFVVEGEPRPVPAGVALNAYRIVQEALTNTLKHAQATSARVVLTYAPDDIELRVSDNGSGGPPDPAPGRGLVGMRQRAALLGGELSAGRGAGRGFVVTANLPARRDGYHAGGTREVR